MTCTACQSEMIVLDSHYPMGWASPRPSYRRSPSIARIVIRANRGLYASCATGAIGSVGVMAEDKNNDGVVNSADLAEVIAQYGSATCWSAGSAGPDSAHEQQKCRSRANKAFWACAGATLIVMGIAGIRCSVVCLLVAPTPGAQAACLTCFLSVLGNGRLAVAYGCSTTWFAAWSACQ